jgi:hypothetical protein
MQDSGLDSAKAILVRIGFFLSTTRAAQKLGIPRTDGRNKTRWTERTKQWRDETKETLLLLLLGIDRKHTRALLRADFFYLSTLVQHFPSRIFSKIEVTEVALLHSLRKHRMIRYSSPAWTKRTNFLVKLSRG